jgi:plastocyanin
MNQIYKISILTALAFGIISLFVDSPVVFAQNSLTISIAPGSSAPNNEVFWSPDDPTIKQASQPNEAKIKVGTSVIWRNDDAALHNGISTNSTSGVTFDTGYLSKGKTGPAQPVVFDKPGTTEYYCSLHPFMIGKITVE